MNSTSSTPSLTAAAPSSKQAVDRRLERLRAALAERNLDAFLSLKLVNTYYLSGFTSLDTARPTSYTRPIVVIVDRDGASLIIPTLDQEPAEQTSAIRDIRGYATSPVVPAAQRLCLERFRELGAHRIGVEEDTFTLEWAAFLRSEAPEIETVFAGDLISGLRAVKDELEVSFLRRSGELSDVAITESLAATRPGVSELEAETQGIVAFRTAAGRDESAVVDCIPIVLSGPRGSMPHEFTSGHCFAPGEPMWHCWITSYRGYWTENIRTAAVAPYDSRFDDLFACLTDGLLAGQEKARPGNRAQQVFEAVMSELRRSTYPGAVLLTRAGHGMGLEYHEPPFVEASDETELQPGMVITVEPGIWAPGIGGFSLSNTIVIGEDANEILTPTALDLYVAS